MGLLQGGAGRLQLLPQLLHLADGPLLVVPLGFLGVEVVPHVGQLPLDLGQMLPGQLVGLLFQGGLLNLVLDNLPLDDIQLGGHGVHLSADHGAGLVHQVDGLVGEEAVRDIAVTEGGGGNDGPIGNLYAVKYLIPLLQAPEDGNGILHTGLVHHDRLEPPLQGCIFFDILPVLVEGGGPDTVQFPSGEKGL